MDMQGKRQLAVTQQQAWDALNNPEVLKACIPGCDKVEASGENQYAVNLSVKIGPVSAKFAGKITLSDIVVPSSYTIAFDGQGGVAGFGKGSAQVALRPNDEGTELSYTVNAQVGGKVAQLGQRLIDGAARSMAEDFFKRFDAEMQRRHPEAGGHTSPQDANVQSDTKKLPVWVWLAGAVVVIAGLYLLV